MKQGSRFHPHFANQHHSRASFSSDWQSPTGPRPDEDSEVSQASVSFTYDGGAGFALYKSSQPLRVRNRTRTGSRYKPLLSGARLVCVPFLLVTYCDRYRRQGYCEAIDCTVEQINAPQRLIDERGKRCIADDVLKFLMRIESLSTSLAYCMLETTTFDAPD
jgi:hypothetical protein